MVKRFRMGLVIALSAALVWTPACTSLKTVESRPSARLVQAGDVARITTSDGKRREIEIDRVSERDVSGQVKDAPFASHRETIKFADIKLIEKRERSAWKSTGAILVGGGIVTAIAIGLVSSGG